MLTIRWSALARADIEQMLRYHMQHETDAGDRIEARVFAAVEFLAGTPRAGPVSLRGDRRKWRVAGTPYILFYRIADDHLRILRVIHGARDTAAS